MGRILWLSRHDLTDAQKSDLAEILESLGLKDGDAEFVTQNVTWQATDNMAFDMLCNMRTWEELLEGGGVTAILGVFPPVAMEAVQHRIPMYSPISRQDAKERADGTKQIEFVHVRWSYNLNWRSMGLDALRAGLAQ